MDNFNFYIIPLTAFIPLVIGFVWYNPKLFGNLWMKETGLTEEKLKSGNFPLILGLSYFLAVIISALLMPIVIHQFGVFGLIMDSVELQNLSQDLMNAIEFKHRSFGHGVMHGTTTGLLLISPILGTIALFERKSFKYFFVNAAYWIVSLALMGGVLCEFV